MEAGSGIAVVERVKSLLMNDDETWSTREKQKLDGGCV